MKLALCDIFRNRRFLLDSSIVFILLALKSSKDMPLAGYPKIQMFFAPYFQGMEVCYSTPSGWACDGLLELWWLQTWGCWGLLLFLALFSLHSVCLEFVEVISLTKNDLLTRLDGMYS